MSWKKLGVGLVILVLYLVMAAVLVYLSYRLSKPTNPDQWKEFGVRAGIALAAVGTFVGIVVTLFTLNTQINAANALEVKKGEILKGIEDRKGEILKGVEDRKGEILKGVEDYKGEILKSVEDYKTDILKELEELKGRISRQNDFLNRSLDIKAQAYNELFKTISANYWELQNLAKGEFNRERARASEQALAVARGLAANLDDEDRTLVTTILQNAYDIVDLAEKVTGSVEEKETAYVKIWNENDKVKQLGNAIKAFNDRSLFYQKSLQI